MTALRRLSVAFVLMVVGYVLDPHASSQSLISSDPPWAGWAQCQITIQSPGYSHRETHRWTIVGGPTTYRNAETYPATWTITGDGSLQRMSGDTTLTAQWKVDGTVPRVEIGVTRHLDRITVQRSNGHGPARGALTGVETASGTTRSRSIALDVQQWSFPLVEDATTSTRITGSNVSPFDGARGPMAPGADRPQGSATCTWDFTRGGQAGGNSQQGSVATLAGGRESLQTAMPGVTPVAPPSQANTATLNDPTRSRAALGTASSEPASPSGGTSASTPTMTTAIVPSVLAVPSASATPAPETSTATTPTRAGSATVRSGSTTTPPRTLVAELTPAAPASVTADCTPRFLDCRVEWTPVSGATGYIVTDDHYYCTEWKTSSYGPLGNSSQYFCAMQAVQKTDHNVGGEASSLTIDISIGIVGLGLDYQQTHKLYVTATKGNGLKSAPVEASLIWCEQLPCRRE